MNEFNNPKLAAKKKKGINIHLYSDDHPDTTQKGTGFKDAEAALRTLEIVKVKPRNRQVWTINAMLNRAKHHPSPTRGMKEAMVIFEKWMVEYRREKSEKEEAAKQEKLEKREAAKREKMEKKEAAKRAKTEKKREAVEKKLENTEKKKTATKRKTPAADAFAKLTGNTKRRADLEAEYKELFNKTLPAFAKEARWPIRLNHCLMRVALDGYWQSCWYEHLNQKKGALKSMTIPQIENVILIGNKMLEEGVSYVNDLNDRSLEYRGKRRKKKKT